MIQRYHPSNPSIPYVFSVPPASVRPPHRGVPQPVQDRDAPEGRAQRAQPAGPWENRNKPCGRNLFLHLEIWFNDHEWSWFIMICQYLSWFIIILVGNVTLLSFLGGYRTKWLASSRPVANGEAAGTGPPNLEPSPRPSHAQWSIFRNHSLTITSYPLKKTYKNDGKSGFWMGKSTISMAMFNSFLDVYQRVLATTDNTGINIIHW